MNFWETKKNKEDGSITWITAPTYDYDANVKKLKVIENARSFAGNTQGRIDYSKLTAPEVDIIADVNRHIGELREILETNVATIDTEISSKTKDTNVDSCLINIERQCTEKARAELRLFVNSQESHLRDREDARRWLQDFRLGNGRLTRPAVYPESLTLHYGIALVAIVGESLANSFFFAQGSELGLLGGWITAFFTSVANVVFSMLFAGFLCLRQTNHDKQFRKILGWMGFLVCLIILLFLQLAIAHYRELAMKSTDAEFISALPALWQHPFGLEDMQSFVLILIGISISVLAIWKGYTLDDEYPGYGNVYRKWKKHDDEVNNIKLDLKDNIADLDHDAMDEMHGLIEQWQHNKTELQMIYSNIGGYFGRCDNDYTEARNIALRLLNEFRDNVQFILGDFPLHESLLDGPQGLVKLACNQERERIENLLANSINHLNDSINTLRTQEKQFIIKLDSIRENYGSDRVIEEEIRKILIVYKKTIANDKISD